MRGRRRTGSARAVLRNKTLLAAILVWAGVLVGLLFSGREVRALGGSLFSRR